MNGSNDAKYKPAPIPISDIYIEKHLIDLVEQLSKNAHDLWAMQKINDNWTWGEKRCDIKNTIHV